MSVVGVCHTVSQRSRLCASNRWRGSDGSGESSAAHRQSRAAPRLRTHRRPTDSCRFLILLLPPTLTSALCSRTRSSARTTPAAMTAPAAKSAFPPPPPFFELYTFPPPPPPLTDEQRADARVVSARAKADALRFSAVAALSLDLYAPPPPLHEAFIKFGEIQPAGFMNHELGPEVPQMFVKVDAASAPAAAAAAAASAAASSALTLAAASSSAATATPATNAAPLQLAGLPPSAGVDFTASLRLLNRQYLQAYLAVLDALTSTAPPPTDSSAPTDPGAHVERALKRLSAIGANLSWLLSALRPHQAMQTVIQMSMRQIQQRKKKTDEVRRLEHTITDNGSGRESDEMDALWSCASAPLTRCFLCGCVFAAARSLRLAASSLHTVCITRKAAPTLSRKSICLMRSRRACSDRLMLRPRPLRRPLQQSSRSIEWRRRRSSMQWSRRSTGQCHSQCRQTLPNSCKHSWMRFRTIDASLRGQPATIRLGGTNCLFCCSKPSSRRSLFDFSLARE